jgi:glycosyltransferase involved in cell wall biosynthesis
MLSECLQSLAAQACTNRELLVVINRADRLPDVEALLSRYSAQVVYEERRGVSAARNRAVRETASEVLLFVDDDVTASPDWLHGLVAPFADSRVACVTGPVDPVGPGYHDHERYYTELARSSWTLPPEDPEWFRRAFGSDAGFGCNMAFRRSFLLSQPFPEDLGAGTTIGCADEYYMFLQVLNRGWALHHAGDAAVSHVFQGDEASLRARLRHLYAGGLAALLKLIAEEPRLRRKAMRALAGKLGRAAAASTIRAGEAPQSWRKLTFSDRAGLAWRAWSLFRQSRRRR